jgi:hypothetical protein
MRHLDFTDAAAVNAWLAALSEAVRDLESVTADALAPLRRRRLGHLEHARLADEAREKLRELLAYAGAPATQTK